jgi:hypothetical protein
LKLELENFVNEREAEEAGTVTVEVSVTVLQKMSVDWRVTWSVLAGALKADAT